jgi:hypothetical protein
MRYDLTLVILIGWMLMASVIQAETPTANEVLRSAIKNRATWEDFPGFQCRLTVRLDDKSVTGTLLVASSGELTWNDFPADFELKSVKDFVGSLIEHRLSATGSDVAVEFADAPATALGRLLTFSNDTRLKSSYRIHDNVIGEVNRTAGDQRFTISVLDVYHTPEGKYLPQTYAVSFWDAATGALRSSETHVNRWTRVGRFDLPTRAIRQRSKARSDDPSGSNAGGSSVLEVVFADHELSK